MKPNYGIDAAPVVRNLALIGLSSGIGGVASFWLGSLSRLRGNFIGFFVSFGVAALGMFLYAKVGKFRHRDRILKRIAWRGDERVLDVGTGRGLLMIGAAKHLTTGRAIGIDIWQASDLSGNTPQNTLQNAELEGVAERIEILSENATAMSFEDESFDLVLSNLCLHNIPNAKGRATACREIARVLRPGGTAILSDFLHNGAYRAVFQAAGLQTEISLPYVLDTFPPLRILTVRKT